MVTEGLGARQVLRLHARWTFPALEIQRSPVTNALPATKAINMAQIMAPSTTPDGAFLLAGTEGLYPAQAHKFETRSDESEKYFYAIYR